MLQNHYLVPLQVHANEKNIERYINASLKEDAEDLFVDAKERLLDVNNWKKYSDFANMDFRLIDAHGKLLNRKARKGDHIIISARDKAAGTDWAIIESLEYDDYPDIDMETFAMRIKPGYGGAGNGFNTGATTTLVIERRGTKLLSSYHGRNGESASANNEAGSLAENASCLWLSDTQWANLVRGLIEPLFG